MPPLQPCERGLICGWPTAACALVDAGVRRCGRAQIVHGCAWVARAALRRDRGLAAQARAIAPSRARD
eukprot:8927042-Pyramimonas_sp.AAC.1